MANIKDLAKMANVSVATVSRVLNHHPYVSKQKREAVWKAVEQSDYQKNMNAVNLSIGKTHLIGIVLPYTNHPYFGLLLEGIAKEAIKYNYKLVLIQTSYQEEKEIEALQMVKHKQIDALIICSRQCTWSTMQNYFSYGKIVFCEDTRSQPVSSTFIDHYKSFKTALDYLWTKGHRHIGYCIGRHGGSNSSKRSAAYFDFLKEKNLPTRHDYIFNNCLYVEDGEKVVNKIKTMNDRPTALLVTSDQVAAGIATFSKQENILIPNDLSLIGFDNQSIAKVMGITTMEIPLVKMGENLLLQSIREDISYMEMDVTLIERETV